MQLYESFGNFDKLDKSLFQDSNPMHMYKRVSPNSEVYVDKLKKEEGSDVAKHTWKYLTEVLLEDNSIAFIVIRSNKRQLLMVSHNASVTGRGDYILRWSDIGKELSYVKENVNDSSYFATSSDVTVRNKICKTVESFIHDFPNAKKNWDVIIVKTNDEKVEKYLDRRHSRENMELKPNDKEYKQYIRGFKDRLKERLVAYSESKLKNILSTGDMDAVLQERTKFAPSKLKIMDNIWALYNTQANIISDGSLMIHLTYKNPSSFNLGSTYNKLTYLHIRMRTVGTNIEITDIGMSGWSNAAITEDMLPLEKALLLYREYLDR